MEPRGQWKATHRITFTWTDGRAPCRVYDVMQVANPDPKMQGTYFGYTQEEWERRDLDPIWWCNGKHWSVMRS